MPDESQLREELAALVADVAESVAYLGELGAGGLEVSPALTESEGARAAKDAPAKGAAPSPTVPQSPRTSPALERHARAEAPPRTFAQTPGPPSPPAFKSQTPTPVPQTPPPKTGAKRACSCMGAHT